MRWPLTTIGLPMERSVRPHSERTDFACSYTYAPHVLHAFGNSSEERHHGGPWSGGRGTIAGAGQLALASETCGTARTQRHFQVARPLVLGAACVGPRRPVVANHAVSGIGRRLVQCANCGQDSGPTTVLAIADYHVKSTRHLIRTSCREDSVAGCAGGPLRSSQDDQSLRTVRPKLSELVP